MIKELMEIYNNSKLNEGKPECIFAETLIFNEGWLLRGILEKGRRWKSQSKIPFLPFPNGAKIYSEAQLYTPFKKRARNDKKGEGNTEVDGIVGNFSFSPGTKSGIDLDKDFKYLAVFEAKMYSGFKSGTENAKDYNQVSRTIACIINSIVKTGKSGDNNDIYYAVIYPKDNNKIEDTKYTREFIESQIEERIRGYKQNESVNPVNNDFEKFEIQWKDILKTVTLKFIAWEDILNEIEDQDIEKFYELCKEFNGPGKKLSHSSQGVSLIYASQINPSTFLHFSWKDEGCALRDYSKSDKREPSPDRSYQTSHVKRMIDKKISVAHKRKEDVSFWHQQILDENKAYLKSKHI